jgi:hypothetical protein
VTVRQQLNHKKPSTDIGFIQVQELCGEMKKKGHAANLSLEDISADHLSMETLLSLTSKRAGEWFKEELRELGGLDHLVNMKSLVLVGCFSLLLVAS